MKTHSLLRLHLGLPLLACALAFACGDGASSDAPNEDAGTDSLSGGSASTGGSESSAGGTSAGGTSSGGDTSSGGRGDVMEEFYLTCSSAKSERSCQAITLTFSGICVDCSAECTWGLLSELSQLPNEHVYVPNSGDTELIAQGGMGGAEAESPACYLMVGDGG